MYYQLVLVIPNRKYLGIVSSPMLPYQFDVIMLLQSYNKTESHKTQVLPINFHTSIFFKDVVRANETIAVVIMNIFLMECLFYSNFQVIVYYSGLAEFEANKFADMSTEEFRSVILMRQRGAPQHSADKSVLFFTLA